jgi:tetratricopeptide (TPR) repeat protein
VGHKAREANTLRTLAVLYFDLGNVQTALGYLNQSLALLEELSKTAEEAEILYLIAEIYTDTKVKDFQKAFDYYNQSLERSRQVGHKVQEAKTLNSMGVVSFQLGNKPTALDYFQQSLPISQEVSTEAQAKALYHIAFVKRDLGSLTEALTDIEAAIQLIEKIRSNIISFFKTGLLRTLHQSVDAAAPKKSQRRLRCQSPPCQRTFPCPQSLGSSH